ncbi:MAG: hypothetical protein M1824_003629 [Vezdaea acicularis]|nr:MAG: hypothetical protein M1824_003629 [Vezdaea acicularis]
MPYLETSQSWLKQSALLLQARPSTTKITTKYNVPNPKKAAKVHFKTAKQPPPDPSATAPSTVATLTLRTYDPVSGTSLKYRTDKAAEVGRLVASLGRLGKLMSGQEIEEIDDTVNAEAKDEKAVEVAVATPPVETSAQVAEKKAVAGKNELSGGKKKKKGKK